MRQTQTTAPRAYGFGVRAPVPYGAAVAATRAALTAQGFGILTEIDVQTTMKEKLDAAVRPYVILGACNPALAHQALEADPGVGLLLPCNVIVYDNGDGTSTVEALDPEAVLRIVGDNPAIATIAQEAGARLHRAVDSLGTDGPGRGTASSAQTAG